MDREKIKKLKELNWPIEECLEYFGSVVKDDEKLVRLMFETGGIKSLFSRMNWIRDRLVEEGYEVPFRLCYRRIK